MNIYHITDLIHTKESSIQFLQERNILRSVPPLCPSCNQRMSESRRVSRGDGIVWRCQRRHPGDPRCNKKQAIRHGSFLVNSNLEPRQFIMLAYFWAQGISSSSKAEMCSVSEPSVIQWNQWFRDICSRYLVENPIRLGGNGSVVQIGMFKAKFGFLSKKSRILLR